MKSLLSSLSYFCTLKQRDQLLHGPRMQVHSTLSHKGEIQVNVNSPFNGFDTRQ
jgi:hypothetical protein